MNRILIHLEACDCQRTKRRNDELKSTADDLCQLAGEVVCIECHVQDGGFLNFYLNDDITPTFDIHAAASHLSYELRQISRELLGAADRLEGGAA